LSVTDVESILSREFVSSAQFILIMTYVKNVKLKERTLSTLCLRSEILVLHLLNLYVSTRTFQLIRIHL